MDRNVSVMHIMHNSRVALRKESVDRNIMTNWKIEKTVDVALRKESVDRNFPFVKFFTYGIGRSPQGERG